MGNMGQYKFLLMRKERQGKNSKIFYNENMSKDITLELITKEEVEETGRVYKEVFGASSFNENWPVEKAVDFVTYLYRVQPDLFFVAKLDGKIIGGIAGFIKPWLDGNHLADCELFVLPEFQKQGISKLLSKQQVQAAIEKYDITVVEFLTGNENEFPFTYYKRCGFEKSHLVHMEIRVEELLKKF